MNVLSYISINKKFKKGSEEFIRELKRKIKEELLEMGRSYSDNEFEKAFEKMQALRLTVSGIDFVLYQN